MFLNLLWKKGNSLSDLSSISVFLTGFWCVHASVQVAEGLAKPPPFPYSCGLTGGNKKKED